MPFNCFDGWKLEGKGTFENGTYTFDEGDGTLTAKCKDEITLPGLGVFFELLWIDSKNKDQIISSIKNSIEKNRLNY